MLYVLKAIEDRFALIHCLHSLPHRKKERWLFICRTIKGKADVSLLDVQDADSKGKWRFSKWQGWCFRVFICLTLAVFFLLLFLSPLKEKEVHFFASGIEVQSKK